MAKGKKTGGRQEGTPNKTTKVTRDIINDLASGLIDKVKQDIDKLGSKDRVYVFLKLVEFNIPKPQSVVIDINKSGKKTIEDKLIELSKDDDNEGDT